jgi:hypothetical protein
MVWIEAPNVDESGGDARRTIEPAAQRTGVLARWLNRLQDPRARG